MLDLGKNKDVSELGWLRMDAWREIYGGTHQLIGSPFIEIAEPIYIEGQIGVFQAVRNSMETAL